MHNVLEIALSVVFQLSGWSQIITNIGTDGVRYGSILPLLPKPSPGKIAEESKEEEILGRPPEEKAAPH